jgi:hypothetical protein
MNTASPHVEPARVTRRLLLGLLLGCCSGCVRSGHSDHYLWLNVQQRSPSSTSALSVHANHSAFLLTYGRKRSDDSREAGPSFDARLSDAEMQQLLRLLEPARVATYLADSSSEERSRSAESALTVAVDAQVANAPTSQSMSLFFVSGQAFQPETRALLDYLSELQLRLYDRGIQPKENAARTLWARPVTFH